MLDEILRPRLMQFVGEKGFYLDYQKHRAARKGKKVTWTDKYGNSHDLDFVIEIGGSDKKLGRPIAFIESAWRRYTRHSKNKAQEIQAAILPIVELHKLSAPFFGVVLAGDYTEPSLAQLRSSGFAVIYIPYDAVVKVFGKIGFDIAYDEKTPRKFLKQATSRLGGLSSSDLSKIKQSIIKSCGEQVDAFMQRLRDALNRVLVRIVLIPLYGEEQTYKDVESALRYVTTERFDKPNGKFKQFDLIVQYSNGDQITATFRDKAELSHFLETLK